MPTSRPKSNALVALVGRANVGKSSLFNRLVGYPLAVTSEIAGTTRDRVSGEVHWRHRSFTLVDTGGLDMGDEPLQQQVRKQAELALHEADVVMLLVDLRAGPLPADVEAVRLLRTRKRHVLLVANKADQTRARARASEFADLGLGMPLLVSASTGVGTGDLLDEIVKRLPAPAQQRSQPGARGRPASALSLALVGRPNVGKSSLVNALAGREATIVNELPGTTRDTTSTEITVTDTKGAKQFVLLDTAGIIRPGKRAQLERYAALRTIRSLQQAGVALLVLDGSQALTNADKRTARHVEEASRPIVIVVNKTDLVAPRDHKQLTEHVRSTLMHLAWAPLVLASATTGQGLSEILTQATFVAKNYDATFPPEVLKALVRQVISRQPIAKAKGPRRAQFIDLRQVGTRPPTFILTVDEPRAVHHSFVRFIQKRLRQHATLVGSPLRIVIKRGKLRRS